LKNNDLIRFEGYELDPSARSLRREGQSISIKPKTFELLLYLVQHPHQLVTKEELLNAVWPDSFVEEQNLSQHVFLLRKALAAGGRGDQIVVTLPGKGYQFAAIVERVPKLEPNGAGDGLTIHAVQSITKVVVEEEEEEDGKAGKAEEFSINGRRPALGSPRKVRRWPWALGAAATALLAVGAWFGWNRLHPRAGSHVQVVIADFDNTTGDATFDRTLNKVVQIDLQQSPYFTVIGEGRLRHALGLMGRKPGATISGEDVREACQRLNAQVYLTPAIAAIGSHYLVTMSANSCADGGLVGARKQDADSKANVLRAVEDVTSSIRKDVGESRASLKEFDNKLYLERTSSLDALKAYSEGTRLINSGKIEDAQRLFQHAIDLDPDFAIAYADLSSAYFNLGDKVHDRENITKAYAMRDTVSERERFQISFRYHQSVTGDVHAMKDTLELWLSTYPEDTIPMANLSNFYTWIGQYQRSADLAARAIELDEANAASNGILYEIAMRAFKHLGKYDKALEYYNIAVKRKIESPGCHSLDLQIAALRHDAKEVDRQIAWGRGTVSEAQILQQAAMAALADGRARDSEKLFAEATAAAHRDHVEGDMSTIDAYRPRILAEMGITSRAKELAEAFTGEDTYLDRLYAIAELGDTARARSIAMESEKESPQDTLVNAEYAPAVLAALAMRAGKPADAVELLRVAEPYELRDPTIVYQRGQAFLAAGKPAEAEAEFRKLIDNPGIDDPLTPLHALAHLNLARALRDENKPTAARAELASFLDMWKSADTDLPPLKEALAEMPKLASK
jgi:DNA-binding winged helix-turn-helix (wHTH) protein/tetratricopeptide (TPR) repeat protein